jgi:hypothetical protein
MSECHCRVTLTDIEGGSHIVEVKASSLFEAVARALKLKGGSIATDGFRPIKVLVFEPKKEHEVRLKDFMAWLDRQGRSPREVIERRKISEILGVAKSSRLH